MSNIYDKSSLVLIPSGTKTGKVYSQKPTNGDGDFTFTRSSAATRVNADGNIEKETGNLLLQSNSFDTTWTTNNASVTSGQGGYDGSSDAWLLQNNSGSTTTAVVQQSISLGSSVRSFSVYAKAGNVNWLRILMYDGAVAHQSWFNLTDGSTANSANIINATSTSVGNGWYRCEISANTNITSANIYPTAVAGSSLSDNGANIYIQDAQLNQGLIAQEVITTTTSAVYGGITDNVPRLDYTDSSCPALLLEPLRTNLVAQSEYFSSYSAGNQTRTANATTSPEGLENAYKLTATSDFSSLGVTNNLAAATTYTASFYIKNISAGTDTTSSSFPIRIAVYDYTNATTILSQTYFDDISTSEWRRLTFTFTTTTAASVLVQFVRDLNNAEEIYIYGAQLEAGSYATSYIPTYGSSVSRVEDNSVISNTGDIIGDAKGSFFIDINVDMLDSNGLIPITAGSNVSALFYLWLKTNKEIVAEWYNGGGLQSQLYTGADYFNIGDRLKIAAAYQDNDFVMYINGTLIGTDTSGNAPSPTSLRIGQYNASTYSGGAINKFLAFPTRLSNEELAALTTI